MRRVVSRAVAGLGIVGLIAWPIAWAQDLPEIAVERSEALCGTDPQLPFIMREVHRAISEHRLQQAGTGGTTGTTGQVEVVVEGTRNVNVGEVAVLEDRGDLVVKVLFVGRGKPRVGFVTDTTAIAQQFYATHSDFYDTIVIFVASTFGKPNEVEPESGFAFARLVKNTVQGIGLPLFDDTAALGLTTSKLRTIVNMNDLGEYVGPTADLVGAPHHLTGTEVLGQEVGHRWAAFVNTAVADILGRGDAHWSFFFDTDDDAAALPGASVMEGNGWINNGDGTFTTSRPLDSYSQLDEYLMGLRLATEIDDPMFRVKTSPAKGKKSPTPKESDLPAEDVTVTGSPIVVTVQDVINANGSRIPATDPATANLAFILVVPDDGSASTVTASDADVAEVNDFRAAFASFYVTHTDDRGAVTTILNP
jgi:hypothetical protein